MNSPIYTADLTGSLKLSAEGVWIHDGVPFQNPKLSLLFHRGIVRDAVDGKYYIRLDKQQAAFDYEDTVFFVTSLDDSGNPWKITLADESVEDLNPDSLSMGSENRIHCLVKDGERARFLRNAHQILLTHAIDENHLDICGRRIRVG